MQTIVIPATDLLDLDTSTVQSAIGSAQRSLHRDPLNPKQERVLATLSRLLPNRGIIVKAQSGLISFGEGLSGEELQYLLWLLRKALTE